MNSKIKHRRIWFGAWLALILLLLGTNALRAQTDSCGKTSNVLIINVSEDPSVLVIGGDVIICKEGFVTLNTTITGGAGDPGYQWEQSTDSLNWVVINGATGPSYTTPLLSDTIWYRVQYNTGLAGCDIVWSEATGIKVVDDPVIMITGGGTVCSGGNLTLQASHAGGTGGCTVFWQKSTNNGTDWETIDFAVANIYTTPNLTQTTWYRAGLACQGIDCDTAFSNMETVVVVDDPELAIAGLRAACLGDSVVLSASANGGVGQLSYQWQFSTDGIAFTNIPGATGINYTTPPLTDTVFYKILLTGQGQGCSSDDTARLAPFPRPTVLASNAGNPFCAGEVVNLMANASGGTTPYIYAWSGPNGFSSVAANPVFPIATQSLSGDYIVHLTDANSCTARDTTSILVNANPTALASNGGGYCIGDLIALQGAGSDSATFAWTGPASFSSNLQNPTRAPAALAHAGTYTLTVTAPNGCTDTAMTQVSVIICQELCDNGIDDDGDGVIDCVDLDCAVGAYDIQADGPTAFCSGDSVVLKASNGGTYSWSNGATIDSIIVSQSGSYGVTVTNDKGCTLAKKISVTVHPPVVAAAAKNGLPCEEGEVTFMGSGGKYYEWTGPNGFVAHWDTFTLNRLAIAQGGNYTLQVTDDFGCTGTTVIAVAIGRIPGVVAANGGIITCAQSTATLSIVSPRSGLGYSWTGPNGFSSNLQNPGASEPGLYTLAAIDSTSGCVFTDTAWVMGYDTLPVVACEAMAQVNCFTDTVQLSMTAKGGADLHVTWSGPDNFTSHSRTPVVTEPGAYTLTVSNIKTGCQADCMVNVEENKVEPIAVAIGGTLTCTTPFIQLFCSASMPGVKYFWSGPGGFASTEQNPIVTQPGLYSVYVVDPHNGCQSENAEATVLSDDGQ